MPETTRNWIWKPARSKRSCDRRSFRVIKRGGKLIRVCCPRGKFKRGVCSVGMKLQSVGRRR